MTAVKKTPQDAALEAAKELYERGLLWIPSNIGQHAAARALVRRGILFVVNGVRHEESGEEVRGYGVAGLAYPCLKPIG
jgi:hypothetical protein